MAGSTIAKPPSTTVKTRAASVVRPGIGPAGAAVGDGGQCRHADRRHREEEPAADLETESAEQGDDREGANAGRRARVTVALAALPLGADQESDPEGHGEIGDQRIEGEHGDGNLADSSLPLNASRLVARGDECARSVPGRV